MSAEQRLIDLGIELPHVADPRGAYVPAIGSGSLCFTAAQLPFRDGSVVYTGLVGENTSVDDGQEAAALATLNALAAVRQALGSLDRVAQVLRVGGYVASGRGFTDQHVVTNGASDLLERIFGVQGRHVRASLGVPALPLNAAVAVELVVEVAGD